MNTRTAAAKMLTDVAHQGRSLSAATVTKTLSARDQAFVQALSYGVCRHYFSLTAIAEYFLTQPSQDPDIFHLILIGLYQLIHMRVPPHAAVAETVAAAQVLHKPWAKKLINAVLRQFLRQQEEVTLALADNASFRYDYPFWLIKKIRAAWEKAWEDVLLAGNQPPPFALRVNQRCLSRAAYLKQYGLAGQIIPETSCGIVLTEACNVDELPGFNNGEISVQDGGAQLAAECLQLAAGMRVLDACAAPGGKTAHILEAEPGLTELIAIDNQANRLARVNDNLQRLQLSGATVKTICCDAGDPASWWDGKLFDRILLDAPCSATGVIRRHPDIKLLRRPDDIVSLTVQQSRLLQALWPMLLQGGKLLYVTCSILPEENVTVVRNFLAEHRDAVEEKIDAPWGVACEVGRQLLPTSQAGSMDGFYFACLRKI